MASSVATSPITGFAPVYSSDDDRELLYQFRTIERTGYLRVSDLVKDFLYDASTQGALQIVNVSIVETHLTNIAQRAINPPAYQHYTTTNASDPGFLSQRIRRLDNRGVGYAVGDILTHYVNHSQNNVVIKVTSVDPVNGNRISTFEVMDSGDYIVNAAGAGKSLEFRRRSRRGEYLKNLDFSFDRDTTSAVPPGFSAFYPVITNHIFTFQSRHFGNGYIVANTTSGEMKPGPNTVPRWNGNVYGYTGAPADVAPKIGLRDPKVWTNSFGDVGQGGPANPLSLNVWTYTSSNITVGTAYTILGDAQNTRWPVDGIWANIPASTNTVLFEGQEIFLKPGFANGSSFIPAGTIIEKLEEIEVVNAVTYQPKPVGSGYNVYESTGKYLYMILSGNVQIDKGDQFYVKGSNATYKDTDTDGSTAEIFNVIVETKSRIDPLAIDRQPVTANVISINGNSVRLGNIRHSWTAYAPTIYEGALITHATIDTNSARVANIANITFSKTAGGTVANIVTDVPLPIGIGTQQLQFTLTSDQPYRLAFTGNGNQTLSISAATAVQLRDDAALPIPRITDYKGIVTDIVGLIGNVPSVETIVGPPTFTGQVQNLLLTVNNDKATGVAYAAGQILGGMKIDSTSFPGMPSNVYIVDQVLPPLVGEFVGGKGRYNISVNVGGTAILSEPTNGGKVGTVIDLNIDLNDNSQGFVNRSVRVANYPEPYPLSYIATFAKQGMFFGIWEGTWSIMQKSRARQISEKDAWFNWLLVQRPVNRKNGFVRTAGQSPVFCINCVGYKYWKFIVRERDVMHPTQGDANSTSLAYDDITNTIISRSHPFRVPADAHTEDSHALLNTTAQIALTEDSKYLVSFLYNLTTPRFRYSDELDLIGQTAADVSMASSDVKITAYGEATPRVYKALAANLPYNAGLRICVLKDIYTS